MNKVILKLDKFCQRTYIQILKYITSYLTNKGKTCFYWVMKEIKA